MPQKGVDLRDDLLHLRLPKSVKDALKNEADFRGETISDVANRAIAQYLEKQSNQQQL